jgi:hypothetical protein
MAIQDIIKSNMATGIAVGLGVMVLAPVLLPALARIVKPVAKAMIKSGFIFYEKTRETFAELGEMAEDLVAEARSELAEEQAAKVPAPAAETRPGEPT